MGAGRGTGRSYLMYQYRWLIPIVILIVTMLILNRYNPETTQIVDVNKLKQLIKDELKDHSSNLISYVDKNKKFPPVKQLPDSQKLRILVTGGSGFVGSHLVDR